MFSYISLNWRGRIAAIPIQRTICRRGGKMTLSAMTMTLEIPDEAVPSVLRALPSPSRALLEGFAVEG